MLGLFILYTMKFGSISHYRLWWLVILPFCAGVVKGVKESTAAATSSSTTEEGLIVKGRHHEPTLLQIVNPEADGEYLRVSEHRLFYSHFQNHMVHHKHPPHCLNSQGTTATAASSSSSSYSFLRALKSYSVAPITTTTSDVGDEIQNLLLQVDKTTLHQVRESLTVSWEGIDNVNDHHDVLALYCDNGLNNHLQLVEAATIEQARATSIKHGDNNNDDADSKTWYIPNFPMTRASSCYFVLYQYQQDTTKISHHSDAYIPISFSPFIRLFLSDVPTNIHLALGDDASSMAIHFTTGSNKKSSDDDDDGIPVAMYWKVDSDSTTANTVNGTTTSYLAEDMCNEPANTTGPGQFYPPGRLHTIQLEDLQPNTQYKYKVGLTGSDPQSWSDEYTFSSPPLVGDTSDYSYLVYGDQGCPSTGWGAGGEWTARMAKREPSIRAVHHFGDLSYARGHAHMWDEWLTMIQPFATNVPLMVGVGNHEYDHVAGGENGKDPSGVPDSHGFMPVWGNMGRDSGGECGVPTDKRFRMPQNGNGVFWYSYDSASVHTIMLSSEHDLFPSSIQHTWLQRDLEAVNRTRTPWVVIEIHRPLYMNEKIISEDLVGLGLRVEFEHILEEYQVDFVLAGHYHAYFRTCPGLFRGKCNNGGPTHITVGTAGAGLDHVSFYNNEWAAKNIEGAWGYGRISIVENATALHFEFVKTGAETDPTSGTVLDDVWLRK